MLIYTVADRYYWDRFGAAFLNSARAHGHRAKVFCDHDTIERDADKVHFVLWRYMILPDLLRRHKEVLLVDIDSVFLRPIKFDPNVDLGIFLRPECREIESATAGGIFYCTDRAMGFAEAMADACRTGSKWGDDQRFLAETYAAHGERYAVEYLDNNFVSWAWPASPRAAIFTAKGAIKDTPKFQHLVGKWSRAKEGELIRC